MKAKPAYHAGSIRLRGAVLWHWLRSSFWFVPSLMVIVAVLLSHATVRIDQSLGANDLAGARWLYTGDVDGARAILSSVASSMITVAGVVFSITIVVLSLASSQFGPRLIWNFMHDIGNQIVLGAFISTFVFCLLLLRRIRGNGADLFVPHLSVTTGILLSMASLGVLIYFIHHVSSSIHASSVAAAVYRELEVGIDKLFPEKAGREKNHDFQTEGLDFSDGVDGDSCPVPAGDTGYLEAINWEGLLEVAEEQDLLLRLNYRPGHFVIEGTCLALVHPGTKVDEALATAINRAFILGLQRTPEQDLEFSVHQLVEIAMRALSPAVNDPFTAMTCIDWLGAAICRFLERQRPSPFRYGEGGRLRIIASEFTFAGLMDATFDMVRQYSGASAGVTIRILESLATIALSVRNDEDAACVRKHAEMVKRGSDKALIEENDRRDVDARFRRVIDALESRDRG